MIPLERNVATGDARLLGLSAAVAMTTGTAIAAADQSGLFKSLLTPDGLAVVAKWELVKEVVADLYHVCRDHAPMMLHWTAEVSDQFWAWVHHIAIALIHVHASGLL